MIAVDTNVLVDLFLPTPHSDVVRTIAERDDQWQAPLLWRSEFASVLAQQHRAHGLPLEAALTLQRHARAWMEGGERIANADRALELAFNSGLSAYDCEFVAVAQELGVPLLSHDARLRKGFPQLVVDPAKWGGG